MLPAAARAFGPGFRTLEPPAPAMAFCANLIAPFGEDFESQRAGERRSLDKLHRDRIAEPVRLAGVVANQHMARLVVTVIVLANRARRHEAVRTGFVELHE